MNGTALKKIEYTFIYNDRYYRLWKYADDDEWWISEREVKFEDFC